MSRPKSPVLKVMEPCLRVCVHACDGCVCMHACGGCAWCVCVHACVVGVWQLLHTHTRRYTRIHGDTHACTHTRTTHTHHTRTMHTHYTRMHARTPIKHACTHTHYTRMHARTPITHAHTPHTYALACDRGDGECLVCFVYTSWPEGGG